jgi:hypothetical protein
VDLLDSHDYKSLLKESMIGLRYKLNPDINLDFDTYGFYNFGIHTNNINKPLCFANLRFFKKTNSYDNVLLDFMTSFEFKKSTSNLVFYS